MFRWDSTGEVDIASTKKGLERKFMTKSEFPVCFQNSDATTPLKTKYKMVVS